MRRFLASPPRWLSDALTLAIVFGLLSAAYLLPPDTSLRLIERVGVLRACVPDHYPPLVTRDPQLPGIDVEILRAVAEDMDLRLVFNTNSAIGRDFNPRNWRLTRSQCQVVAGGVVDSVLTRSFLETTPSYLEVGWAIVLPRELSSLEGRTIGFYAGITGLDRIALSRYLREQEATVRVVNSSEALVEGLADGTFDAAVSESLTARRVAEVGGWDVKWLPVRLERYHIVLGLWKGDLTLQRRIERALAQLEASGELDAILGRYDLAPLDEECAPCAGVQGAFLPSYSPDLNPIEQAFAKLKASVKRSVSRTRSALDAAIAAALETVTLSDVRGWFKHAGYLHHSL